jgi:hypothetical protein
VKWEPPAKIPDLAGHPCDDPDLDEETLARHSQR